MKRQLFIMLLYAALLASGAAFADPGEAEIAVTDGRLTVSAQDAAIGNLLSEISLKAGFELDMNPAVGQKTVTTSFSNLELQKGIERLLSLIRHKDYFIYYGKDGGISKIEIHGPDGNGSAAKQRSRTSNPLDTRRNNQRRVPTRPQMRRTPPVPNGMNAPPIGQPSLPGRTNGPYPRTGVPPMPVNPEDEYPPVPPGYPDEEEPDGMVPPPPASPDEAGHTPYIPPARMPAYIPPKR